MNLNTAGWASRALTPLLRIIRSSPNTTVPVVAISEPINSETAGLVNSDIALVAKGTGATVAQVPDGTIAGGSKRGTYATDWQKSRTSANQVANAASSSIAGGSNNRITSVGGFIGGGDSNLCSSNAYTVIGGGSSNTASGNSSFVGGGTLCNSTSNYSFVGGGESNTASTNTHSTVCGGSTNTASGSRSFIGGGESNSATGQYSLVTGGANNSADQLSSTVVGGRYGTTRGIIGYTVFPATNLAIAALAGAVQSALLCLAKATTDATATVLTSNGAAADTTNQVTLPNNSAYYFRGSVIAGVTGAGNSKSWTFEGAIKRGASAGTTAIVGTVIINTIAQDAGASAWSIAITANTTLGCIAVTVTGAAATTIRWVAKIETTEMTY